MEEAPGLNAEWTGEHVDSAAEEPELLSDAEDCLNTPDTLTAPFIDATLRDGRPVRLRPVRPDDKPRIVDFHEHLSVESRFHRFHATVPRLSEQMLRYFTEVDQHEHVAWGAIDPEDPEEHVFGIVRCVRLPNEPTVAEVAVTITDDMQNLGLGTLLTCLVAGMAYPEGIRTLRFVTTDDNAGMIALVLSLGGRRTVVEYPEVIYDLELPIPRVKRADNAAVIVRATELATGSGPDDLCLS